MFDFQKEVIINSAKMEGLDRVKVEDGFLKVLRCADYKLDNITEITKTPGHEGKVDVITLAVPAGVKAGDLVHAEIVIGLEGKYMADYANVWSKFGKDIVVEYEAVDADVAELEKHIKDALPLDNAFVKVAEGKMSMTDSHQIVKTAFVSIIADEVEGARTNLVHAGRVREFATGAWLRENLRFPTHLNLRYDNVAGDDAPIAGTIYDQYSFQYESERKGLHGQGTVGQKLTSVTTHTFYVPQGSAVAAVFDGVVAAKNGATENVGE